MSKMWSEDGSITVEMSMVFPVILMILWLVIYLIMYIVDVGNINYMMGIKLMDSYLYTEQEIKAVIPQTLSIGDIDVMAQQNKKQATVKVSGNIQIPFLSIRKLLGEGSYDFQRIGFIDCEHPIKTIRRRKMLEAEFNE